MDHIHGVIHFKNLRGDTQLSRVGRLRQTTDPNLSIDSQKRVFLVLANTFNINNFKIFLGY